MKLKDLEPYHRKLAVLRVQEKTSIEGFYMIGPTDSNFPHTAYVAGFDDALLYSRAPEMLEKLKKAEETLNELFNLIDSGVLVRNTSKDHLPEFTINALRLTLKLKDALTTKTEITDLLNS